jgi:hypothetical protein
MEIISNPTNFSPNDPVMKMLREDVEKFAKRSSKPVLLPPVPQPPDQQTA